MWTLLLAAHAQHEICEPLGAEVLSARTRAVAQALAELRLADADRELSVAREEARCLDAPIQPDQLATLAWLHAERAVFDQDPEEAWRWVRLAQDTAPAVQPPEHVGGDHPLRRVLRELPEPAAVEGPDRALDHPRGGGIYLDGQRLDRPRARAETPHLVQVFDRDALVLGAWQQGARFPPELLVDPVATRPPATEAAEPVGPRRWKPARKDTVKAWESWLLANPDSPWADEARGRLDDRRFAEARRGGEPALRAYLADTPGRNARGARGLLERVDFDRAAAEPTRQSWQVFLARHPGGVWTAEAQAQLDALTWAEMRALDTEQAYARYLTQLPDGAHRAEARELRHQRAWESTPREPAALRRFLERFPGSPHRTEARRILGGERFAAVRVAVNACPACADALSQAIDAAGLRPEPAPFSPTLTPPPEGTALLRIAVEPSADGERLRARAELWSALGGDPLAHWVAEAPDPDSLADALVAGLPDLSRWR